MDAEEDDFLSGSHSDDGGGTPVQDEHHESDGGEMRSGHRRSTSRLSQQDEDVPTGMETGRAAGGSDGDHHRGGDSDSDGDAPGVHHDDISDSEADAPRPAESEDNDDSSSLVKRPMSRSENEESPSKQRGSDYEEGAESPARGRGGGSDMEEGAASPGRRSHADGDSEAETPARRKTAHEACEEEEGGVGGAGGGAGGGGWKAVLQSDSEDDGEHQKGSERRDKSDEDKLVKRKKAVLSDSEEDNERTDKPAAKRSRAVSDDSEGASAGPDESLAAKLRELGSDSGSEEDERTKATEEKKDEKALFGSDSDSGEDDEEEKMIADIFGESGDEEDEEFTGFNQEDLEGDKEESNAKKTQAVEAESDSDEGVDRSGQDTSFMSDFDIMLARRKALNSKRRRHRDGGTFISDADDVVSAMISKMNEAAEEDRMLNSSKKPALKKLTLLPHVVMHLKKQDLKETFIDSGVMTAIKEWISPLPDKSLPALRIREELLRILQELPSVSQDTLKHSGIGRAVMFLYKHPKESRSNKELALKLINEWSRPIFGLTSNYKGMTREERQQRDLDQQMPQRRRLSSGGQTPRRDLEKQLTGEEKALRPGDPGFCARARVPMPSNKDYVVRPKWNVEMESSRGPMKKGLSRVDKQMRRFADIRRLTKPGHAVKISVEGNRMPL
ncbi:protein IWS1 homolog [Brachionichthys hirsutus]|uniref:protein IWS1 homolog n=1 Tax=Brachionichthys hirsutus TaxID=412623 RepID=UPI0036043D55